MKIIYFTKNIRDLGEKIEYDSIKHISGGVEIKFIQDINLSYGVPVTHKYFIPYQMIERIVIE